MKDIQTETEFTKYLESNEGKDSKAHVDRIVGQAVQSYITNHPAPVVEPPADERDAENLALRIENKVILECQKRGIERDLLEDLGCQFTDLDKVDAQMETIGARLGNLKARERNDMMLSTGFRPGGSPDFPDKPKLENLSQKEIILMEEAGTLDDLIGGLGQ